VDDKPQDERRMIEAAQADPARFLELYERNFERLYAYVSRRVGDRAAAEDITSQVFEQALRNIRGFEWRGTPFIAWLFRMAGNAIADRWRLSAREAPGTDVPDRADVDDELERRVLLFQLVDRLPELQRAVIRMRFGGQQSISAIAAALGKSEGAVKQLQLRALQNLRKEARRDG
jgi:RNA polymerase sigma-70 factor, ECF subfamily